MQEGDLYSNQPQETTVNTELEIVRKDVDSLISQEGIDKSTALGVVKLLHTMENMLLRAQFEGEKATESLRNELTVSKLTHNHADMLATMSSDLSNARQRLSHLENVIATSLPGKRGR